MAGFAEDASENLVVPGARMLVIAAQFNREIVEMLCAGALTVLECAQAEAELIMVPGALEIPIAAKIALEAANKSARSFDGVIALGCVIRGDTYHFEVVSNESARALMDLSVSQSMPLGNGVLTVENEDQAYVRADPQRGDKGGEAARAALVLTALKRSLS